MCWDMLCTTVHGGGVTGVSCMYIGSWRERKGEREGWRERAKGENGGGEGGGGNQ